MSFFIPFFGVILCFLSLYISKQFNFYDRPSSSLKIHKKPILYCGGLLAIFTSLFHVFINGFTPLAIGILLMAILGVVDDKKNLSISIRLTVELAIIFASVVFILPDLNFVWWILFTILGAAVINAVNFIDIKDGLCTGFAIIFISLILSSPNLSSDIVKLLLVYSYGLLCFYYFNSEPAKIYQGDGGAYSIGYIISFCCLSIISNYTTNGFSIFTLSSNADPQLLKLTLTEPINFANITPIFGTMPLYFELIYVFYRRIRLGLSPFKGSPDHIAIVFVNKEYSTYRILLLFSLLPILLVLYNWMTLKTVFAHELLISSVLCVVFVYKYLRLDARTKI